MQLNTKDLSQYRSHLIHPSYEKMALKSIIGIEDGSQVGGS